MIDFYGPQPDPAWQQALSAIAPQTPYGHDWLKLVWESGDPWDPVHRWVVYQMTLAERIPLGLLDDLRGPDPRTFGHYDHAQRKYVRHKAVRINLQQWLLFQHTGCLGRPLWVVQGSQGGHLRRFNDVQSSLSEMNGGPIQPPAPGDLPYAEPDHRTWAKLKQMDMVEKYGDVLRVYGDGTSDLAQYELSSRERKTVQEMATQLWNWLDIGELELTGAQVSEIWDRAHGDDDFDPDAEAHDFIESVTYDNATL